MAFKGVVSDPPAGAKPPEPGFHERPEKSFMEFLKTIFNKYWLFIIPVSLVILVVVVRNFHPHKNSRMLAGTIVGEEKRRTISRDEMEQAISEAGALYEKESKTIRKLPAINRNSRNYATDIAVYVHEEEPDARRNRESKSFRKENPLGLPSGTRIPAIISNRIFSFNVAAPVIANVENNFKFKNKVVIPKGSKFFGEASVLKSIDRINVSFDLLIFPDGRQVSVHAMALSMDGSGGIKGSVQKHRDVRALKAIGETLLGGASLFMGGGRRDPYSFEDQMRYNLAQNLTGQAAQDLRSVRVEQSVTVESNMPIDVMLLEAI